MLKAIHRLQSGRSHEVLASPVAMGPKASERPVSLLAQPAPQWKHPELFSGTTTLPDPKRFNLKHFNWSTDAQMPLIQPFLNADENHTQNRTGVDLNSVNNKQLQSLTKTNIPYNLGQPSQNDKEISQLQTTDDLPKCQNKDLKDKDSSNITEVTDIERCALTTWKLTKKKSFSDTGHGQCDNDEPLWTLAASKIRFKALPQTQSRPIQPLADDYVLVMRLLQKGYENDPSLLRAIGVAESRHHTRTQGTSTRRMQRSVTIFPTPRKPPLATSSTLAHKPCAGARRWERSSSTQRRQKVRTPKSSANKKSSTVCARSTAYGKQSVHKPEAAARTTPNAQKRRADASQRAQGSSPVVQQRAAPEKKRDSDVKKAAPNQKPPAVRLGARCESQASVPSRQTSKPILTSDLRRVLEASAAKTQHALKRAASDCERLSRTSTPSTNNLLKRVASDLKRISRDSMASFNNLQQEAGKISVPKAPPSQTAKLASLNNSKVHTTSNECCSSSSSLEIKCHMPDVSASVERCRITQQTKEKPCAGNSPSKCNTMEAGKIIPYNSVSTTSPNPKPEHKTIKNNPADGIETPACGNNTLFPGICTVEHQFCKPPRSETNSKHIKDAEKNNPWQGLRPPDCCVNAVHQTSICIPTCGLRPPHHETVTVQKSGIENWDGLRTLSTKSTPVPQSPDLCSSQAQTKKCVPKTAITKISNLPLPFNGEGKECIVFTGLPPAPDIRQNDKGGIESVEILDTSLVSTEPTPAHSATTKSCSLVSQPSQELLMADETLSSGKQSFSSFASSTTSCFGSDSISRSEASSVSKKKRDYSSDDESQRVSEKSTLSSISSVSSSKSVPFFQKVRNIFRIRFSCCKSKLPCMRPRARGVSASSRN